MKLHLKEDVNDVYCWDELTPEQQAYVIKNWSNMPGLSERLHEWWDEDNMSTYEEEKQYIADKYADKYGLSINPDELYWKSNSHGPYPEWDLGQVFNVYEFDTSDGDHLTVEFYGSGFDVEYDVSSEFGEDTTVEDDAKIDEIVGYANEYLDEMWSYIKDVCRAYPDDEWVTYVMDNNPGTFEFTISDTGKVECF